MQIVAKATFNREIVLIQEAFLFPVYLKKKKGKLNTKKLKMFSEGTQTHSEI